MGEPRRTSQPYTTVTFAESADLLEPVQAGERVERDDGWWRCVRVSIEMYDDSWKQLIEWVPTDPVDA